MTRWILQNQELQRLELIKEWAKLNEEKSKAALILKKAQEVENQIKEFNAGQLKAIPVQPENTGKINPEGEPDILHRSGQRQSRRNFCSNEATGITFETKKFEEWIRLA